MGKNLCESSEKRFLREYFDKHGIEKIIPIYKEKTEKVLEKETKEFTGNIEILKKSGLEEFDLGKPTCTDIILNPKESSRTIPQAYYYNGHWLYNLEGAKMEANFLGKSLPSLENLQTFINIANTFDDGEKFMSDLGMNCFYYYGEEGGLCENKINAFIGRNKKIFKQISYWILPYFDGDKEGDSFYMAIVNSKNVVNISNTYSIGDAFPVRCLKK